MEKVVISNDIFFAEVLRVLREGKNVTIPVKGVSMLPFIRGDRDSVELEPLADARPLAVGDIVLFRVAGRYILHRIIQLMVTRLLCKAMAPSAANIVPLPTSSAA